MTAKEFIETYINEIDTEDLEYVVELGFLNLNKDEWFNFMDYMHQAEIDMFDAIQNIMSKAIHGALDDYCMNHPADEFMEDESAIKEYIHSQLINTLGLTEETINRLIDRAIEEMAQ